jgi:CubicO group peptidase (beta-lactamase class C family)
MKKLILFISFFLTNFCFKISAQKIIDSKVLDTLIKHAELTQSDALVIFLDGKLYNEYYFGKEPKKIEAMSSTKSIVNLAIGKLITDGLIKSIDQPVYDFYPEWNQGMKKDVTIRHLLNHTSGMQNIPLTTVEIYPSPDFIKLALAAEIVNKPGTTFSYNNKAVNLLAGIVKIASRKRMDNYLEEKIFKPLGIEDFDWELDDEGNPHAMAGFQVLPKDLAKLGQLFIQKGKWEEKQLISETWFIETGTPNPLEPTCGLLWWIEYEKRFSIVDDEQISKLEQAGLPDTMMSKIRSLKGRYATADFTKLFGEKIIQTTPDWNTKFAPMLRNKGLTVSRKENVNKLGYSTRGYLGNLMVVYPDKNLVVVRMITNESFLKGKGTKDGTGYNNFIDFFELSTKLIQ